MEWQGRGTELSSQLAPNLYIHRSDHNTGNSTPYSSRIVCGFFNVNVGAAGVKLTTSCVTARDVLFAQAHSGRLLTGVVTANDGERHGPLPKPNTFLGNFLESGTIVNTFRVGKYPFNIQ